MATVERGKYNKRVVLSNPTKTTDGAGGHSEAYTAFLSTFARVTDGGGARVFDGAQDQLIHRKTFDILYRASLASALSLDTHIAYSGKDYAVEDIMLLNETKETYRIKAVAR